MKPFSGVLRDWRKVSTCIIGRIVWHRLHDKSTGEFAPGHRIKTSPVKKASWRLNPLCNYVPTSDTDFVICETQNSFYVLLGPENANNGL